MRYDPTSNGGAGETRKVGQWSSDGTASSDDGTFDGSSYGNLMVLNGTTFEEVDEEMAVLTVVTKEERPYVMLRSGREGNDAFEGFAIDLLKVTYNSFPLLIFNELGEEGGCARVNMFTAQTKVGSGREDGGKGKGGGRGAHCSLLRGGILNPFSRFPLYLLAMQCNEGGSRSMGLFFFTWGIEGGNGVIRDGCQSSYVQLYMQYGARVSSCEAQF